MNRKGQVSSVNPVNRTARVTFKDLGGVVTAEIRYAKHVAVNVNDMVAVAFFSANLSDGLIIAVF